MEEKYEKVKEAFWNPKTGKYEPKTWAELVEKIPKGTLSPLLNTLIREGFVEGKAMVNLENKRRILYELVNPFACKKNIKSKGVGPAERITVGSKGKIMREEGLIYRKYGQKIFRRKKEG